MGTARPSACVESLESRAMFNVAADPTFGNGGVITTFIAHNAEEADHAVALKYGLVLVQGRTVPDTLNAGYGTTVFALYTSTGNLATGFHGNGKLILPATWNTKIGEVLDLKALPDGTVLIVGYHGLAKLKTNGTFDTTFGAGGIATIPQKDEFATEQAVVGATGEIKVGTYSSESGVLSVKRFSPSGELISDLYRTIYSGGGAICVTGTEETIAFPASEKIRQYRTSLQIESKFGVGGDFDLKPLYTAWANSHKPWTDEFGDPARGIPDLRIDSFIPPEPTRRGFAIYASVLGTADGLPFDQDHGEFTTPLVIDIGSGGTTATFYSPPVSGVVYGHTHFISLDSGDLNGPHFGGRFYTVLGNVVTYEDLKYDNLEVAEANGAAPAGDGKYYVFGWTVRDFGSGEEVAHFTVDRTGTFS